MKVKEIVQKVKTDFPHTSIIDIINLIDEFIEIYSYEKEHFVVGKTIGTLSSATSVAFPTDVLTINRLYLDDEELTIAPTYKEYFDNEVDETNNVYDCYINNRTIYFASSTSGDLTADCLVKYSTIGDLSKDEEISVGKATALLIAMYVKYRLAVINNRADWKIMYDTFSRHYTNVTKRKDQPQNLRITTNTSPV